MPNQTSYLKLKKPLSTEMVDIAVLNANSDMIDNEIKKINCRLRANVEYIKESKVWRVPSNVMKIDVFVVDGGYDGESKSNSTNTYGTWGSGGKGGGMLYIQDLKVSPGQAFNIVVGAANGGKSSFGDISGTVAEAPGGSGSTGSGQSTVGKPGVLGKVNNYYQGMPCPIDGKYYGVSGAAGGGWQWSCGTADDIQSGRGGMAGKSLASHLPQGGCHATTTDTDGSVSYDAGGGGGASYDNAGAAGIVISVSSGRYQNNIGGVGGKATSYGCGGGGCGAGGGTGGAGAPGGVIIGY